MSEKYQPKKGDHVRVVLEGETSDTYEDGKFWVADTNYIHPDAEHVISIEKLASPEPKWVYGAVVKTPGYRPLTWDGEQWRASSGRPWGLREDVSEAWKNGTLEVLWNEDFGE